METSRKTINVVAALIRDGKRVFATARGYGNYKGWWEFPGGKVEPGESPEDALVREIREELDSEISVDGYISTIEHDYPEFHLSMDCFLCSLVGETPKIREHESTRRLTMDHLKDGNWLPADLIVIGQLRIHETNEIGRNHYGRFGTDEAGKDLYRQDGKWD